MARLPHTYYRSSLKRMYDIVVASAFILIGTPLFLFIAAVIAVTAGGPVIFCQKRYGLARKVFTLYKFRTMHIHAEKIKKSLSAHNEAPHPMFKMKNDPRFIGAGKWLSLLGVDELPQLYNVLKGDMSLVGPRPLPLSEANALDSSWNFRYTVKPGIFSEWAADTHKHSSLIYWRELEKKSLVHGSLLSDTVLIIRTCIKMIIRTS